MANLAAEQEAVLEGLLALLQADLASTLRQVDAATTPAATTPAPQTLGIGEPKGLSPWPQVAVIPQGWSVHSDDEYVRTLDYQVEVEARVAGPDPQAVTRFMLRYAKAIDYILRANQSGTAWKAITVKEARNSPTFPTKNSGLVQAVSVSADVRAVLA